MYFFFKMFLSLVAALFVAGAAILKFNKRYADARKVFLRDFLRTYVQAPTDRNSHAVNHLSLRVDDLNNNFRILGDNQREDHKLLMNHEHRLDHDRHDINRLKSQNRGRY